MGRRRVACFESTTHHPYEFPWSIHVVCEQRGPHRVHVGHADGFTVMWVTVSEEAPGTTG